MGPGSTLGVGAGCQRWSREETGMPTPEQNMEVVSTFAASPDLTAEIHDMVAAGDRVGIRATHRGTDKGGFIPGMPATGKAFEMEAIYIVRVDDAGKIAEHWGVVDTIGTRGLLGLLPPPAEGPPA